MQRAFDKVPELCAFFVYGTFRCNDLPGLHAFCARLNEQEAGDAMREAARREGLWAEADPDGYRMYKARQL